MSQCISATLVSGAAGPFSVQPRWRREGADLFFLSGSQDAHRRADRQPRDASDWRAPRAVSGAHRVSRVARPRTLHAVRRGRRRSAVSPQCPAGGPEPADHGRLQLADRARQVSPGRSSLSARPRRCRSRPLVRDEESRATERLRWRRPSPDRRPACGANAEGVFALPGGREEPAPDRIAALRNDHRRPWGGPGCSALCFILFDDDRGEIVEVRGQAHRHVADGGVRREHGNAPDRPVGRTQMEERAEAF